MSTAPRVETKAIADFYDAFAIKGIQDYVFGNARISSAIDRCCSVIDHRTRKILDVGCGIGATSYEFHRRNSWVNVLGVDISPQRIAIAQRLFESPHVKFEVSAITGVPPGAPYDLITMIDVYEHFPRRQWPAFHRILAQSLTDAGTMVLTTPTSLHQSYLATHKPEALQVVDETVETDDVVELARDTGGTIVCYDMVSIWNTNDYLHVVISRCPRYEPVERKPGRRWRWRFPKMLSRRVELRRRRRVVHAKLGVRI